MEGPDDIRMTLGEHFEELRRHLLRAVIAAVLGVVVCAIFGGYIMQIMCWPAAAVMRYRGMQVHLRVLSPAESINTYTIVCLVWGLIVSAPYGLWQMWQFIGAGLYPQERRLIGRYVPLSLGLFVAGVAFFLVVMAPICLNFFLSFGQDNFPTPTWSNPVLRGEADPASQPATMPATAPAVAAARLPVLAADPPEAREGDIWINAADGRVHLKAGGRVRTLEMGEPAFLSAELTLENYMTFVSGLSLMFGLGFQVPIVVLVLTGTGLVKLDLLRRSRKYVILVVLIIAAVLTPPDVVSQFALAIPMYALFELGLLLARRSANDRRDRQLQSVRVEQEQSQH